MRSILLVVVFSFFLHMSYATARVTASLDALDHGVGAFEVGILMCLLSLLPTFLAMRSGRWIDRVGGKKPFTLAFALLFTSTLTALLFPVGRFGVLPLYLLCTVVGVGFMFMQMTSLETVGFLSKPKDRMNNYAVLSMGYAASGLISPIIAGHLIDFAGHTAVYACSVASSVVGFLIFLFVRSAVPEKWVKDEKAAPAGGRRGGAFELLYRPDVRHIIIVSAIVSMAWELENFMFPVYGHIIGLSATEIGWLLSVFYSATFIVRAVIPVISKFLNERQCLFLVLLVGGASYIAFPFFTTLPPLIVVAFFLGIALGASQPNVLSILHRVTPEGRIGEALGIRTMFRNAAHAFLPVIFGFITGAAGPFWIFIAQGGLMGATAASAFRHRKDDEGEEPPAATV